MKQDLQVQVTVCERNLMAMMGEPNKWYKGRVFHVNSSYNDLLLGYWVKYDKFMLEALVPNNLTSMTAIDRAIRSLPGRLKNISNKERMQRFYGK